MLFQGVTAEQRALIWNVLQWTTNHLIIPLAIWGYRRLRTALRAEKVEIIAQITSSVQNEVNSRIAAHEVSDVAMFNRLNVRLDTLGSSVQDLASQMKALQLAFQLVVMANRAEPVAPPTVTL